MSHSNNISALIGSQCKLGLFGQPLSFRKMKRIFSKNKCKFPYPFILHMSQVSRVVFSEDIGSIEYDPMWDTYSIYLKSGKPVDELYLEGYHPNGWALYRW